MGWDSQDGFAVRFDWGVAGVTRLAPHVDVVVVVDVLRFSTATVTAVEHGLAVHPYRSGDRSAPAYAASVGATLAGGRIDDDGPSLCPASLRRLAPGTAVVLPSPNGATGAVTAAAAGATVVAGCLRNAAAVARWAGEHASAVAVVACGERWRDGSLLPAIEDLLGAGSILAGLRGRRSPEAVVAAAAYAGVAGDEEALLAGSSSGIALAERGHADDVAWAAQVSASGCVPLLRDGRFVPA